MRLIDVHGLDILGYLEEFPECESDKAWNAAVREICTYVNLAPEVDAVPVVRCGNCKHIRPEVDAYAVETVGYWCGRMDFSGVDVNGFCSYGERKDGDGPD